MKYCALAAGFNVTVLAYGQTGSGKTFSMGTNYTLSDEDTSMGIIPRAVCDIFKAIAEKHDHDITVKASFVEVGLSD